MTTIRMGGRGVNLVCSCGYGPIIAASERVAMRVHALHEEQHRANPQTGESAALHLLRPAR